MVVDSHVHFGQRGQFSHPPFESGTILDHDFLPEHIKPSMDGCGVQRTLAAPAVPSIEATRWLLELAEKRTYIGGVVGWVDLTCPHLERTLDELGEDPNFKGLRHPVESDPQSDWLIHEDVLRGLGALAQRNLPFDLLVRPEQLRQVLGLADRIPNLRMIVDHIAKPPIKGTASTRWSQDLAEVAQLPSVYCKLSGMTSGADHKIWEPADLKPYVDTVLELFGEDRVMFGSAWPVCLLTGTYAQAHSALVEALRPLCPQTYARIFGLNAVDFYQLGSMPWSVAP